MNVVTSSDERPLGVRIGGLLPLALLQRLLDATLAEERWFVEASTEGRDGHRRALVLYTPVDEADAVVDRLRHLAPRAARALGCPLDEPVRVESQQTVHLDGGFYRAHRDDQGDGADRRLLSYVYYFHRLPRAYRGGALCLHDGSARHRIEPTGNELVVFPSRLRHEVLDVEVPSGAFADARFTVNGWLWR